MCGVKYASAQAVNPLGTILAIGMISCESETWGKPASFANSPIRISCSPYLRQIMNDNNKMVVDRNYWYVCDDKRVTVREDHGQTLDSRSSQFLQI